MTDRVNSNNNMPVEQLLKQESFRNMLRKLDPSEVLDFSFRFP
jgi:hypothetical protein